MENLQSLLARFKATSRNRSGISKGILAAALVAIVGMSSVASAMGPSEFLTYVIGERASSVVTSLFSPAPKERGASVAFSADSAERVVCATGCEFADIASAVAAAAPGDTIVVRAGSYRFDSSVIIDKPLNIVGPNDQVAGHSSRRGAEAEILSSSNGAFEIRSNDVTISGFKFTGTVFTSSSPFIVGNASRGGEGANARINYNVFEVADAEQARIQNQANPRARGGAAVLASGEAFADWSVVNNQFKGMVGSAVRFFNTNGGGTVAGNRFDDMGSAAVQLMGTELVVIDSNWVDGAGEEGFKIGAGSTGTIVRGNSINRAQTAQNPAKGGIWIDISSGSGTVVENNLITDTYNAIAVGGSNSDTVIRNNHFAVSNVRGLYSSNANAEFVVNAENNYWGSPNGPNRFGGEGSAVVSEGATVDADPYISRFTEGPAISLFDGVARPGFWPQPQGVATASNGEVATEKSGLEAGMAPPTITTASIRNYNKDCDLGTPGTQPCYYNSVQAAIDAAADYDTIKIGFDAGDGTLVVENNIVITKPVKIYGPNEGSACANLACARTVTWVPGTAGASATPSAASPWSIFRISATLTDIGGPLVGQGLEIKGFSFDGNGPDILRGISRNGIDIDVDAVVAHSVLTGVRYKGFRFQDNKVVHVGINPATGAAVQLVFTTNDGTFGTNNEVGYNSFSNVGGAVLLERNYSRVVNNFINDAGVAIAIDAHSAADSNPGANPQHILSNIITSSSTAHISEPVGISVSRLSGASAYDVDNNEVTFSGAAVSAGIGVRVINNTAAATTIRFNDVTGGQYGYLLTGGDAASATIQGDQTRVAPLRKGVVTGAVFGVRATTDSNGGGTYVIRNLNIVDSLSAGVDVFDQGDGVIAVTVGGATGTAGGAITSSGTNTVKGVVARGGTATATVSNYAITGQGGVQYDNQTGVNQTATCVWWGANTGPAAGKIVQNTGTVTTSPYKLSSTSIECTTPSLSSATATSPVTYGQSVTLGVNVTEANALTSIQYKIGSGSWTAMTQGGAAPNYTGSATVASTSTGVGTFTVYFRATDTHGNVSDGTLSTTFTVNPKTLTVIGLAGNNKAYDGTTAATASGSAVLSGVESGDTANVTLGGTPVFTFATPDVGTNISISTSGYSLSGTKAPNYSLTQPTLSADITSKALTVTGLAPQNKVYDGTKSATVTGGALSGVADGDDVTLVGTPVWEFVQAEVGTAITLITNNGYTLGGADAANYSLAQPQISADITKRFITISGLSVTTKTYDGTTAATVTGTPVVGNRATGQTSTDVTWTLGGSYVFANKNAGTWSVTRTTAWSGGLSGTKAANYDVTPPTLTGTISKKAVDLVANDNSKTYGASEPLFTHGYDATDFVSGEGTVLGGGVTTLVTITGVASCGRVIGENVGTYEITCEPNTLLSTNYSFVADTATFTINAKALTITGLTGNNRVYNGGTGATAAGTAVLNGVIAPDVVTLGGTPSYTFNNKNVGTAKTITTTGFTISGAGAANYSLTQPTLSGNITAKGLTITGIVISSKVYDGNTNAASAVDDAGKALSGVETGDLGKVAIGGTPTFTFDNKNKGTNKTITTTGYTLVAGGSGDETANYTLTQPSFTTGAITAKALTITGISSEDKIYDGNTAATTYGTAVLNGVVSGDAATLSGTPVFTFADKNVGNWAVTATGYTVSGGDSGNYTVTQPTLANANILQRPLTLVGLAAQNKAWDGTTTATVIGTATLTNVVSGETVTLTAPTGAVTYAFDNANVGNNKTVSRVDSGATSRYSITQPASNYSFDAIAEPTGLKANITGQVLTATVSVQSKVYDGTTAATITSCTLSGVVIAFPDVQCSISNYTANFADKNVNTSKTYTVTGLSLTGSNAGGYSFSGTASGNDGEITKATLNIAPNAISKEYGSGADPALTYAYTGYKTGDDASNVTVSGAAACTRAVGETVAGGPYTITCTSGSLASTNYLFATGTSLFTITKRSVTMTGLTGNNKVYDRTTAASASGVPALSGVISTDAATATLDPASVPTFTFATRNVGTAIAISTTGYTLTGAAAPNYLLVQPTLSGNITPKALGVSGAAGVSRAYDGTTVATINFGSAGLTGVIAGDTVTLVTTGYTAVFDNGNVGSRTPTVSNCSLGGANAGNYSLGSFTAAAAAITKKALSVNAVAKTKVVGTADPVYTFTLSGFVTGESTANVTITGQASCERVLGEAVGTYVITCQDGTLSSANYSFSTGTTALMTITGLPYGTVASFPAGATSPVQWSSSTIDTIVSVQFPSVSAPGGTTTVSVVTPADPGYVPPPSGVTLGTIPMYFDISTTIPVASFGTPVRVCFTYPIANYPGVGAPAIYRRVGDAWQMLTNPSSTSTLTSVTLCADTAGFSNFAMWNGLPPTAAPASIGGRITDGNGRAVRGANVTITDTEAGVIYPMTTNQFGRYSMNGLVAGRLYIVTVSSKLSGSPISREVTLYESLSDVDFGLTLTRSTKPPVTSQNPAAPVDTSTTTAPRRVTVVNSKRESKQNEDKDRDQQ